MRLRRFIAGLLAGVSVFVLKPVVFQHAEAATPAGLGYITPASSVCTAAAPTAPASTSVYAFQGLACYLTPVTPSGKVVVTLNATLIDSATTVGEGVLYQLYYGLSTAPTNSAAVPGNSGQAVCTAQEWATGVTLTTAALLFQPISITCTITGLSPGTQYWFDLAAKSVTGASIVSFTNVVTNVDELS